MINQRKVRIGIIGSATDNVHKDLKDAAIKLGELIASNGYEAATGTSIGAAHIVILKAKELGAKTIGFSPDSDSNGHIQKSDNASLCCFDKVFFISGFTKRSIRFIFSCDAIIVLGGRMGTLSEYAIAFEENKPIGVLTSSGEIAGHLKKITAFCNKHRKEPVFFCSDAEKLFRRLVEYLKKNQWQNLAIDYKNYNSITDERLGYLLIIDMLKDKIKDATIMDYGCGHGKFIRRLKKYNPKRVFGLDISSDAIMLAKEIGSGKVIYQHIKSGDISLIANNSLDIVFVNFVLCCVANSHEIEMILSEIHKKLKLGGDMVILEPNPDSLGYKYVSMEREKPCRFVSGTKIKVKLSGMKNTFYDYWRSLDEYKDLLENAGFKIDAIKEPIVEDCPEEEFWKDEKIQPPLLIMHAKKVLPFC